jgi:ribosome-associated protein
MAVKRTKTPRRSDSATARSKTKSAKRPAVRKTAPKAARKPVAAPASRSPAAKSAASKPAPIKASVTKVKPPVGLGPQAPIVKVVENALDDMKAVNVKVLDVRKLTDIADTLIIASGNSDRHVRSIADRVTEFAKKAGFRPTGVEGERDGEWVLVDLRDVIVHIMLPRIREFYRLENLWDVSAARREAAGE